MHLHLDLCINRFPGSICNVTTFGLLWGPRKYTFLPTGVNSEREATVCELVPVSTVVLTHTHTHTHGVLMNDLPVAFLSCLCIGKCCSP